MDKTQFEKAKFIERRIFQLELFKEYVATLFDSDFLNIGIEIKVLAHTTSTPIKFAPYQMSSKDSFCENQLDKEYLLSAIQKRIDELKSEFDKI